MRTIEYNGGGGGEFQGCVRTQKKKIFFGLQNLKTFLFLYIEVGRGWIYRKYVRLKGGQAKCVRLRTRGEGGLILVIFVRTYYVDDPLLMTRLPKQYSKYYHQHFM